MSIMYCNFNMFDINSQVVSIDPEGMKALFSGTFEEICEFMATEYQTLKYEKIVLSGPYGDALADRVRAYSIANYKYNDINIEVIK